MKIIGPTLFLGFCLLGSARADLTLVQKIEGAGPGKEMTLKVKGNKARIEMTPAITAIVDSKTGEVINLMHEQKMMMRISAETAKAAAEMMDKAAGSEEGGAKAKIVPTGKKEKVNGYDTEQYVCDMPKLKATYWVALNYPNGTAILKELQTMQPEAWSNFKTGMPDYRDLPGLPLKTLVSMGNQEFTTTITSVKQDPISDSEFVIPTDYKEIDMSKMLGGGKSGGKGPGAKAPGDAAAGATPAPSP